VDSKDLLTNLQEIFRYQRNKNVVIIGGSGAGKTLLLIKLLKNL
jgi:DNA replication protein DnaC